MFYLPRSSTQQPFRLFFCCGVSLASKKWETLAAVNNYHAWGWFILLHIYGIRFGCMFDISVTLFFFSDLIRSHTISGCWESVVLALFRTGAKLCKRKRQGLGVQTSEIPNIWICNKSVIFFYCLTNRTSITQGIYREFFFSDGEMRINHDKQLSRILAPDAER